MKLRRKLQAGRRGGRLVVISGIRHDESSIRAGYKRAWMDQPKQGTVWLTHSITSRRLTLRHTDRSLVCLAILSRACVVFQVNAAVARLAVDASVTLTVRLTLHLLTTWTGLRSG